MNPYASLPQVGKILSLPQFAGFNKATLSQIAKEIIQSQREQIAAGFSPNSFSQIVAKISLEYEKRSKVLSKVINATGVVLHTNLGRSPLNPDDLDAIKPLVCGYCDLEFDLDSGKRGDRYKRLSLLLCDLLGCEDALVVNNNAAAAFLVINTLAKGAKSIISYGEMVEIGGSFRVPEVMREAGTQLVGVGTTNKTRSSDYERAIDNDTKLLIKVHKSNFEIVGFKDEVGASEIAKIAHKYDLPCYYDLGGGYASPLPKPLNDIEADIKAQIKAGVDILSFSGDKLFGSVQCGIIVGKTRLIQKLRQNQILRMLRVDKLSIALLSRSILAYSSNRQSDIAVLNQLHKSLDSLKNLAAKINSHLKNPLKIKQTSTFVGGGSLPNRKIASIALSFENEALKMMEKFRALGVVGRIEDGEFLLDLRAILPDDESLLIKAIQDVLGEGK